MNSESDDGHEHAGRRYCKQNERLMLVGETGRDLEVVCRSQVICICDERGSRPLVPVILQMTWVSRSKDLQLACLY